MRKRLPLLLLGLLPLWPAPGARAADPAAAERQYRVARRLVAEGAAGAAAELHKVFTLDPQGELADDALVEEALLLGPARWPDELGRLGAGSANVALKLLDAVADGLPAADRQPEAAYLRALVRLEPLPAYDSPAARRDLLAVATDAKRPSHGNAARHLLAWMAEQDGDVARARTAYQRLIVDAPGTAEAARATVGLARILIRDGEYGAAARWLQEAVEAGVEPADRVRARRELAVRGLLAKLGRSAPPVAQAAPAVGVRSPAGIVVLPDGGVVLADRRDAMVIRFDASGRPLGQWPLEDVVAISAGVNDTLWVAAGDAIYRLVSGEPPREVASQGDFATVSAMTVDGEGGVWVVDRRGERVGRIDPGGGAPRLAFADSARKIKSLVWDGRRLLALDARGKDVVAYTTDGHSSLVDIAGLLRPAAIAVDAAGRAAVLDTKNERVLFSAGSAPLDYRATGVERPTALAFGWDGVLHLYDDAAGGWVRFP